MAHSQLDSGVQDVLIKWNIPKQHCTFVCHSGPQRSHDELLLNLFVKMLRYFCWQVFERQALQSDSPGTQHRKNTFMKRVGSLSISNIIKYFLFNRNLYTQTYRLAKDATWMPNNALHATDAAIIKACIDIRAPLKQKSSHAGLSPCD